MPAARGVAARAPCGATTAVAARQASLSIARAEHATAARATARPIFAQAALPTPASLRVATPRDPAGVGLRVRPAMLRGSVGTGPFAPGPVEEVASAAVARRPPLAKAAP